LKSKTPTLSLGFVQLNKKKKKNAEYSKRYREKKKAELMKLKQENEAMAEELAQKEKELKG